MIGRMTPKEAQQLLDLQKGDEKAMILFPSSRPTERIVSSRIGDQAQGFSIPLRLFFLQAAESILWPDLCSILHELC